MKDIPINNPDVLKSLNNFLWYFDNKDLVEKSIHLSGKADRRKYFMSEEYRNLIMQQGQRHDGYPETAHAWTLKAQFLEKQLKDTKHAAELYKKYNDYNTELCSILCTKNNALTTMYPPGGYISWHNNANACAYNLIFSWSETGEGEFRYVDGETGEEITMKDKKGWQCKAAYFGHYGEHESKIVYHAAETDCYRITVSYMFDRSDMSRGIQDEAMEEIMYI